MVAQQCEGTKSTWKCNQAVKSVFYSYVYFTTINSQLLGIRSLEQDGPRESFWSLSVYTGKILAHHTCRWPPPPAGPVVCQTLLYGALLIGGSCGDENKGVCSWFSVWCWDHGHISVFPEHSARSRVMLCVGLTGPRDGQRSGQTLFWVCPWEYLVVRLVFEQVRGVKQITLCSVGGSLRTVHWGPGWKEEAEEGRAHSLCLAVELEYRSSPGLGRGLTCDFSPVLRTSDVDWSETTLFPGCRRSGDFLASIITWVSSS